MLEFFTMVTKRRIQMCKSEEKGKEEEANSSKNNKIMVIDDIFQEIVNLSFSLMWKNKITKVTKKLEKKMNNIFESGSTKIPLDNAVVLAMAYYNLSRTYHNRDLICTEDYLKKCISLLAGIELNSKAILLAIRARIDLYTIWFNIFISVTYNTRFPVLNKAILIYLEYTNGKEYQDPIHLETFLQLGVNKKNAKNLLHKYHLETIELLISLYFDYPKDKYNFALYTYNVLCVELPTIRTENKMAIYWAKTSADLSFYFLHNDRFAEAKYCIAAADNLLAEFASTLMDKIYLMSSKEQETFLLCRAHIFKLWGIYGVMLLRSSRNALLYKNDKSCNKSNIESKSLRKFEEKSSLYIDLEEDIKNISDMAYTYVSNLNDAKEIFTKVVTWFDIAKMYFTVEKDLFTHIQIIINLSNAYKYYMYFIKIKSEQRILVKQQIKMLENTINALHLQRARLNHIDESCKRKVLLELAIAYFTLLNINNETVETDKTEEDYGEMRMEWLVKKIIENLSTCTI